MDEQLPSPRSLRSLVCDMKYPHGNYLIHQLVLNNSEPSNCCSESYIRFILQLIPDAQANARNEDEFTALHLAVMTQSSFMVKMLLSCLPTVDVNARCLQYGAGINAEHGESALHLAVGKPSFRSAYLNAENYRGKAGKEDSLEIIRVLVESGAAIDAVNKDGNTALSQAVICNQIDIIKLLITKGADLDRGLGKTPLHDAASRGFLEEAKVLVESGAYMDAPDVNGHTALHVAAIWNQIDILKLLISKGIDVDPTDSLGSTPLCEAAKKGCLEAAKVLVESGADINAALHFAADCNQIDVLKLLISKGADLKARSVFGPLHVAVSNGYLEIVKFIVESDGAIDAVDLKGNTALHIAAVCNQIDILQLLISKGTDLNAQNRLGETPLHFAAAKGYLGNVKVIVESGAAIDAVDLKGNTALHNAAKYNEIYVLQLLISKGADLNAQNRLGETPLHVAVQYLDIVKVLVESGAAVDSVNRNGSTALRIAEILYYVETVEYFNCRLANVNAVNRDDRI